MEELSNLFLCKKRGWNPKHDYAKPDGFTYANPVTSQTQHPTVTANKPPGHTVLKMPDDVMNTPKAQPGSRISECPCPAQPMHGSCYSAVLQVLLHA